MACAPSPVALSIGNVSLASGGMARGVSMAVGSPAQQFAFMPRWPTNDTYIFDAQTVCDNHTDAYCSTIRGGSYDAGSSTTRTSVSSVAAAGGSPDLSPFFNGTSLWVDDSLMLNGNTTISSFPLGIGRPVNVDYFKSQAGFGLGFNSTIINSLRQSGKIASRTWSMFWGQTGAASSQQSNGTFVFGGYDAAKISGANYTKTLNVNSQCGSGMLVTLSDIRLQYPNGSSPSLYSTSKSTAVNACIGPDFPGLMTLPLAFFKTFQNLAGVNTIGRSFGYNFYDMLYDPSEPTFYGDIVIELDSVISITIPNSQIVEPQVTIANDGSYYANYSVDELLINPIQDVNANDLPILGRQFLSAAMVMVNQDVQQFTIWQASPSSQQRLIAVDPKGNSVPTVCTAITTNGTASGSAGVTKDSEAPATPIAAIAGGAVGGVAVLAGLLLLALLVLRRRRKNSQTGLPPSYSADSSSAERNAATLTDSTYDRKPPTPPYTNQFHEMEGRQEPSEMPASTLYYGRQQKQSDVHGVHELG